MASRGELLAGRYTLIEPIGSGGMAVVWRARDDRLRRQVAIKLLRPQYAEDDDFARRFQNEARNAASLSHPNIATVFDADSDGDTRFIVMELVDGPSLADVLARSGRLPVVEAVAIAASAARALGAAHRRGLVHRDVKPGNLLLGRDGRVRLADFGIARALTTSRVTAPGTVLGSLPYMSPEQARGEEATPADDLFSLGVVLFEMVHGRLPWGADAPGSISRMWEDEVLVPLSESGDAPPDAVGGILTKALSLDSRRRYPSARSFADALDVAARRMREFDPDAQGASRDRLRVVAELGAVMPAAAATGGLRSGEFAETGLRATARANPSAMIGTPPARTSRGAPQLVPAAPNPEPRSAPPTTTGGSAADSERRQRAVAVLALSALIAFTVVAARLDADLGSIAGVPSPLASATAVAVVPMATSPVPSPTERATESQTPSPSPSVEQPPAATPPPEPTPPAATPDRTTISGLSPPSAAVVAFYGAVEAHDWDTAIGLWSESMQERYPPDEWLIGRFSRTERIDVLRVRRIASTSATATVVVTIREYRTDAASPRTLAGDWDLILVDGRWLLDDPDF
jgi:serine/threonine-protein kinase